MTLALLARRQGRLGVALLMAAAASMSSAAQESIPDLSEASLEQLANVKVYAASRHLQPAAEAPSSITVITAESIQEHGYRRLGDVLQTVRGFL